MFYLFVHFERIRVVPEQKQRDAANDLVGVELPEIVVVCGQGALLLVTHHNERSQHESQHFLQLLIVVDGVFCVLLKLEFVLDLLFGPGRHEPLEQLGGHQLNEQGRNAFVLQEQVVVVLNGLVDPVGQQQIGQNEHKRNEGLEAQQVLVDDEEVGVVELFAGLDDLAQPGPDVLANEIVSDEACDGVPSDVGRETQQEE